jgi:ribose transport system permease protein
MLAGAFVIAVIHYDLFVVKVEPFWQFVSVRVIIIISVLIVQVRRQFGGERMDE